MAEKLLSIIIPIYNEEKIVAESLPAIFNLAINKEVIIVNDGSTDQTAAILNDLNAQYNFKLINHPTNQGKGAAVGRGLEEIRGDYFIICDADLEYSPDDITRLWQAAQDNKKDKLSLKRIEKIGKRKMEKFLEFKESFNENANLSTLDILDSVIKQTEYLKLYDENDEDDRERLENIKELRSVAVKFPVLTNFLENVSLVEQEYMPDKLDSQIKKDAVTLMTLHAAKGLEWERVFLMGVSEGLLPLENNSTTGDQASIDEGKALGFNGDFSIGIETDAQALLTQMQNTLLTNNANLFSVNLTSGAILLYY